MDKNWLNSPRYSTEYQMGLQQFLDFAFSNTNDDTILCPCKKCSNGICRTRDVVLEHVLWNGFLSGYTKWILHGELSADEVGGSQNCNKINALDNMPDMLQDRFGVQDEFTVEEDERPCKEAEKFYKLMEDAEKELYPGCQKFSKLSFIIRLLQIKCLGNWTNSSFTLILDLLRESFPEGVQLPKNYYETKKILRELGLNYNKIDACRNDCMLYWGANENKMKCDTCDESRWVTPENTRDANSVSSKESSKNKVSAKVMWHFPLKPRLQRLFMNSKTASLMKWHDEKRIKDGFMRHPADSPAWHTFDYHNPDFAKDSRNVRLGLATDGFNPFKTMNVAHSTWPVILIPYNLPPGDCMKKSYLMLCVLIPGPTEPGNNLDIYLQPLIAELKELFEVGIKTYDASSKENFQMRAAILWTVSDFPGLASISGWSTKGAYACPICYKFTNSKWLDNSHKYCYMCHRIFLPPDHPYRNEKGSFDGTQEHRSAPPYLKGSTVLDDIKGINNRFGKHKGDQNFPFGWKKRSILFDLPYWEKNLVRHNLDVMHIEKNVCDKVLFTLMDSDKSKDNYKARLDLQKLGLRPGLHPFVDEFGKKWIPASSFTFNKSEKERFCKILKNIKVPDGYAANVSRCVHLKPNKIFGLKSHDSHILMQQLLPLSLRQLLPKSVRSTLMHLSRYFRDLCSKTLHHIDLARMEKDIALILCQMEKIFPPAFFDIMVHLTVHLVTEAKLAGPVHYRWMYPVERYLSTLKSYVRNRSRPEGSIAEGYLAEECLAFCSLYFDDNVETRHNRVSRNSVRNEENTSGFDIFFNHGSPLWKGKPIVLDNDTLTIAHRYILFNCDEINSYREQHEAEVRRSKQRCSEHEIKRIHSKSFATWFHNTVQGLNLSENDLKQSEVLCLARGPIPVATSYKGYKVNGFRFHIIDVEKNRKNQNSGVMVNATTTSFASKKDRRPIMQEISYFGIIKTIIELDYTGGKKITLFECDWVSKGKRLKEDDDGFTLTNFTNIKRQSEPFVLASQVEQVFYVDDPIENDWRVVIKTNARDKYDDGKDLDSDGVDTILQSKTCNDRPIVEDEDIVLVRDGAYEIFVDNLEEDNV